MAGFPFVASAGRPSGQSRLEPREASPRKDGGRSNQRMGERKAKASNHTTSCLSLECSIPAASRRSQQQPRPDKALLAAHSNRGLVPPFSPPTSFLFILQSSLEPNNNYSSSSLAQVTSPVLISNPPPFASTCLPLHLPILFLSLFFPLTSRKFTSILL